ncbi:MAG: hypothetical protein ACRENE_09255 [Polyangiaceae bacterium]
MRSPGFAVGVLAAAMGLAGLSASCSRPPPDSTPESAVRLFLEAMDAAGDDPRAIRRAYDLLGPAARANLAERARRTSLLQGRQVQPWEMLSSGMFGVSFRTRTMHPNKVGDRATVEVSGETPQERASVVCVCEGGAWHVEPGFPEI